MSEEEFDELLNLMSENNLTQHGADTLYGEIVDREIERKRLNNIINEFDKWLLGERMMFYNGDGETLIRYNEAKNKWLELKERS